MIAGICFTAFILVRAYKRNARIRQHHQSANNGFGISTIRTTSPSPPEDPDYREQRATAPSTSAAAAATAPAAATAATAPATGAELNMMPGALPPGGSAARPGYDRLPLVDDDRQQQQQQQQQRQNWEQFTS